jgi:hypothetical protein
LEEPVKAEQVLFIPLVPIADRLHESHMIKHDHAKKASESRWSR